MKKKQVLACTLSGAMVVSMLAGCGSAMTSKTTASTAAGTGSVVTTESSGTGSMADAFNATDVNKTLNALIKGDFQAPDWSEYDSLIDEIRKDTDLKDREAKLHQAEDMLMATGAVCPIYYYNDLYLENTAFSGDFATVFGTKYFMYAKKDGKNVDKMNINLASEPDHLDPALNSTVDGAALAANSFVGLYTYNSDGDIVAALADGDPQVSDDGTEYTIKMKTGLKWSDGSTLNANDFVYSWKRAADPATASDYSYLFAVFDGYSEDGSTQINVQATDDNTITFKLAAPCPYMMQLLAFPVFMPVPQKSVEAANADGSNPGAWASEAGFVTDGAYTLKTWKHNESMTYVKNPNFYDADNVSVDELDFMLSADDSAILAAFQSGDLDYADTVPTGEIQNLKDTPEFHVIDNLGTYYVCFNVNSDMFSGMTAVQAAETRRALSMLIDRQYIVDTVGQTEQKVATSFVPIGMSDGNGGTFKQNDSDYTYPDKASVGYYPEDVDTDDAIALLKDAGFKFGDDNKLSAETPLKINYLTNDGTGHEGVAQAIQQDFAAIGIDMEISVEDWQTFLNDRKSGNFDVARGGWLADYDDPINMLDLFTSASGNDDPQLGK